MAYKVINRFFDNKDKVLYNVGEEFPKGDSKPSKKRISELSEVHPKFNRAFIEEVKEEKKSSKIKNKE